MIHPGGYIRKQIGGYRKDLVLSPEVETELIHFNGSSGCLTHQWFGGDRTINRGLQYGKNRIRIYVDGEGSPSVDGELFLLHGIGFGDTDVWTTPLLGKTGSTTGLYNFFPVPFGEEIRVTVTHKGSDEERFFWWCTGYAGDRPYDMRFYGLPILGKLRLRKLENYEASSLEHVTLFDVKGKGRLFCVILSLGDARGIWGNMNFLEGCVSGYSLPNSETPSMISSGTEDFFLATEYVERGRFYSLTAGVTHLDQYLHRMAAYRLFLFDPIFFDDGYKLVWRNGEKITTKGFADETKGPIGDPGQTNTTAYIYYYDLS